MFIENALLITLLKQSADTKNKDKQKMYQNVSEMKKKKQKVIR